jgi:outer membrane protein
MQKKLKQILYLLMITSTIIGLKSLNAQSHAVNIKQAVEIALANNSALRADSLNIIMTGFQNKQLAGRYLPQVSMGSKLNYNLAIPSQMLPGNMVGQPSKEYIPVQFGTKYEMGSGIEVNQYIFRKDLLININAAPLNNAIAHTRYKLKREELVYQVVLSFYSLQSKAELIRNTTSDYDNMKGMLAIAKAQFEAGTLKRIDYESFAINVANKHSQLDQLKTQYNQQLDYFKYLIGLPVETKLVISTSISESSSPSKYAESEFLQRADIHLYDQLIQAKEVEIKSIDAEKLPTISSYFKYNRQAQFHNTSSAFDNNYWFNNSTVGFSVSVSLFDGNKRKNRLRFAQTESKQLRLQSQQQQQKAETEFKTAKEALNNNRVQYRINTQNLALAEKVFASRKSLYTEGVSTLLELLDAEKELTQARNLHSQSMIDVQTGWLDLHKANGTLLTEFVQTL